MSSSAPNSFPALPIVGQLAPTVPLAAGPSKRPKATAPLPMTRGEMAGRGWDEVDVVFVTGDAYVDHPSFAMALLGRLLESEGFRVAILSQPDWQNCNAWRARVASLELLRRARIGRCGCRRPSCLAFPIE